MNKRKIPTPYILAGLLLLCAVGLPIAALRLGDLNRLNHVRQEPLPYNLSVQQEPYSTAEKLEILMNYDGMEENMTMAQQALIGSELWNRGLVQDVVDKKLAEICGTLNWEKPELEIKEGIIAVVTDKRKPALSLRVWGVELAGAEYNCQFILDVDTGSVYGFYMGTVDGEKKEADFPDVDRIYNALTGQVSSGGSWWRSGKEVAVLGENDVEAYFSIFSTEWDFGWTPDSVLSVTAAPETAAEW
ncbi:MAG: hypothetical protein ACOX81_04195 [Candidatus Heteroscillospira sp.]|jgi:hypothetical protein